MAGGARLRLAINPSFIILVRSCLDGVDGFCLLLSVVLRGNGCGCGCTAGRVRLMFNFFPSLSWPHTHNLDLEEGLAGSPRLGWGWAFSLCACVIVRPSKVVDLSRPL